MREVEGTITDRGLDHLIPKSTTAQLEAAWNIGVADVQTLDEYQELAAETAIYPRVYTEIQVLEIVGYVGGVLDPEVNRQTLLSLATEGLDIFETPFNRLVYPILGLVGEAGEIANKAKKIARDNGGQMDTEAVEDIEKELGDIGWYFAAIATELRTKLSVIASANISKLFSRRERGVLGGSGDNR